MNKEKIKKEIEEFIKAKRRFVEGAGVVKVKGIHYADIVEIEIEIDILKATLKGYELAEQDFKKKIEELATDIDDGYHPIEKYVNVEELLKSLEGGEDGR